MITLNPVEKIVESLEANSGQVLGISKIDAKLILNISGNEYFSLLSRLGGIEIACDFYFLKGVELKGENTGRPNSQIKLWDEYLIFSCSGNGDAWLIKDNRIFFLDHEQGEDSKPIEMELNIFEWLQLADVIRQFEHAPTKVDAQEVEKLLVKISPSLVKKYPYKIEI